MAFHLAILLSCNMALSTNAETQLSTSPSVDAISTDNIHCLDLINRLSAQGWVGEPASLTDLSVNNTPPGMPDLPSDQNSILREFGCKSFVTRSFKRGNRYTSVNLYYFAGSAGAYGTYSVMREGASTVVIRGDASSEDDDSISFWQGNYYVHCHMTSQDDDESKEMISALANNISASIKDHAGLPDIMGQLPKIDRIAGTEKFVMGPLAFKRYTNLPFANTLALNQSLGCGIADYLFEPPNSERMKMILVEYITPEIAQQTFVNYKNNIAMSHDPVQDMGDQTLFRLSESYLLCRVKTNRIVIISGAKRKYSPNILLRLISF